MVFIFTVFLFSLSFAQDMQINYKTEFSVDAKIIGPIKTTFDRIVSPGHAKVIMKIDAKKWLPSTFIDRENGTIMMTSEKNILKYDIKEKEYWLVSTEDYFKKQDQKTKQGNYPSKDGHSANKRDKTDTFISEIFFEIEDSFDENDEPIQRKIDRLSSVVLENVNGFNAKKWTTQIEFTSSTRSKSLSFIIEEWIVDQLPLQNDFHSLLNSINQELNPIKDQVVESKFKFSSDDFVKSADSTSTLKPLEGYVVKAKATMNDHLFLNSMNFEITELYTVPFDPFSFAIPEEFKRIQKKEK